MQLKIGESQTKMSFTIIALQLQRGLKILGGFARFTKIVQHEAAIDVSGCHLGIAFERQREILQRRVQVAVVYMHIAGNERQVLIFGEDRLVFSDQRKGLVIAAEIIKIVSEVDDTFAIIGQLFDHLKPELRCFGVVALEREITFALASDLRARVCFCRGTLQPALRQVDMMSFQCGVRASGYDQRIVRHALIRTLVIGLGEFKFALCGVEIAQSEVGGEVFRMRRKRAGEVRLRQLGVAAVACQVPQRRKCLPVVVVEVQNLGEGLPGCVFLAHLPKQGAEIH